MSIQVTNNRYPFPAGYRRGVLAPYIPWNGFVNGNNSPQAAILGGVLQIVSTGVPADLSTFQVTGADGNPYLFQFVYNASVWTQGIKIPLPASGGSTAAQVMTQIVSVLGQLTGTTFGGAVVSFPWVLQTINATTSRLNANIAGTVSPGAFPANITITAVSANVTFGLTASIAPARAGFCGAFLPGA